VKCDRETSKERPLTAKFLNREKWKKTARNLLAITINICYGMNATNNGENKMATAI